MKLKLLERWGVTAMITRSKYMDIFCRKAQDRWHNYDKIRWFHTTRGYLLKKYEFTGCKHMSSSLVFPQIIIYAKTRVVAVIPIGVIGSIRYVV